MTNNETIWVPMTPSVRDRLDKAIAQLNQTPGQWGTPVGDFVNTMASLLGIHQEQLSVCIWNKSDIRTALNENGLATNNTNIDAVSLAWKKEYGSDLFEEIEDISTSRGWDYIEAAIDFAVMNGMIGDE